jgi:DNA-binding CsgD family transcriptional regulator
MPRDDATTRVRPYRRHESDGAAVACVEILSGAERGLVLPLEPGAHTIGRAAASQVRLDLDGVSRRHATITVGADGVATISDLGSTNGTFVNGMHVTRIALREGDRIDVGPEAALRFGYRAPAALPRTTASQPPAPPLPLSDRELEIAQLVAEGMSNDAIGKRLFISGRTVGTHLRNIYQRLEIHTRAELVRLLAERGPIRRSQ